MHHYINSWTKVVRNKNLQKSGFFSQVCKQQFSWKISIDVICYLKQLGYAVTLENYP